MTNSSQLAFVFPGQGSQSVGMLADLAVRYPIIGRTFAEASDALNFDLWQLVQTGDVQRLNQTANTQPAMLAAGVAVWRLWQQSQGVVPAWLAGHSLGEYSALVAADAMDFADAVRLVAHRGKLMQLAVPDGAGAMAAIIGISDEQVVEACRISAKNEVVAAVNFNAPGQVVIAGNTAAVAAAMDEAKAQGAKRAILLPVSVPSHCALMQNAAKQLAQYLASVNIAPPKIPIIHNVDVAQHPSPSDIKLALAQQLSQPVHWSRTISHLVQQKVSRFIECGTGKVLSGLGKRIAPDASHSAIYDTITFTTTLENNHE